MTQHEVEHTITVDAPAAEVYRLIAEVENWPLIFPPCVHVDVVERGSSDERIRIRATANGEPKSWTSRRELDPDKLRIGFAQEVSAPPVAAMGGTWVIEEEGAGTRIRLLHHYRAVDDDPAGLAWIDEAVDRNSRSELAALKVSMERVTDTALTLSFADSVRIDGSAKDVYDFVNEAQAWQERLPHVAKVDLREDTPGLQVLRMDTRTADGATHTTESVRVCFPHHKIAYKQTTLPALLQLHTGYWEFTEDADGVTTATSQHTVILDPDNITAVLGAGAGVEQARVFIRGALGGNSRATLGLAKAYAEVRR
ncbi:aromatase/cyclase [Actinacidiphila bryophytorum]|uniref:Granaticin polyketide synthase bifunctional cyclase/dehydratase n=1 Tax=Actinacidiphila bryophytorum TaxID=1436133 RepID=A0A9W4H7I3_9ACTN|nr:aromatase/cyclase [Actinacidiphila bryophytorum]MBM9438252.1 aromatase/cyclase [Actinacidiphila bryophytorum]MBN6547841.1 aromatase/cyclase [Actinacidiphila bryophytorum]CAG7657769.1 Granaticin polyketide synthase bifunctional cyclase/dehydratase [Actinacidiphila bryophytorum]